MSSTIEFANKHRRKLQWVVIFLAVYSLIGFFLVPWLVERQLGNLLEERLQLETEIESLYFNPFTFYSELNRLEITENDGSPLLQLENLVADLHVHRLILLQVRLNFIAIDNIVVALERESAARNTISVMAERWQSTQLADVGAEQEAADTESGSMFPVVIESLQLQGDVTFTDSVPAETVITSLGIDVQIDELSTLADAMSNHNLRLDINNSATLQNNGTFSLNPLYFEGDISILDGIALSSYSPYASSVLPISIDSGELGTELDYRVDLSGDSMQLELSGLSISLDSLSLSAQETGETLLDMGSLSAGGGNLHIPENSATVSNITVSNLTLTANREADGSIDLQQLFAGTAESPAPALPSPSNTPASSSVNSVETVPWTVAIEEFQLSQNQLVFSDRALRTPYTRVATLDLLVSDIDNQPGTQLPFEAAVELDSGGTGNIAGNLTVLPQLAAAASLTLEDLALNAIDPFLNEFTTLNLQSGELNSTLSLNTNESEPFAVSGDLAISNIELIDTVLEAPLLSLENLQVDSLDYSTANNEAEVSELLVAGLGIRVIINEGGTTNIGQSIRPASAAEQTDIAEVTPTDSESGASLPAITLGRIRLENAAADFTDRDLPFEFNANVVELNANIDNISNTTSELTQVSLEGQVGEFGLMQLETELDPFDFTNAASIDLRFSNIDLPEATPYVIKFAGREVDEGSIDLRLNYTLENQVLDANNQMTLNDLVLGDEVEYPDAMNLPLDLALALLKDSNGVIDFEVPVSGELDNPEFDLGPAIRRAITNILTNIVAAPFRLLGNLVGAGEDANIDQVRFLPAGLISPLRNNRNSCNWLKPCCSDRNCCWKYHSCKAAKLIAWHYRPLQ